MFDILSYCCYCYCRENEERMKTMEQEISDLSAKVCLSGHIT